MTDDKFESAATAAITNVGGKLKKVNAAAALALAYALGAGTHGLVAPAHAVSAEAVGFRVVGDGQLVLDLRVKDGGGVYPRQLVWDKDGGTPRLNGKAVSVSAAVDLGKASAAYAKACGGLVPQLADLLATPAKKP